MSQPKAPQCAIRIGTSGEVLQHVEATQALIIAASAEMLLDSELEHLRVVIRLVVEFKHYLELSCTHQFCRAYVSESIFSGIDSYCIVTRAYKVLSESAETGIAWPPSSEELTRQQFDSIFGQFEGESSFERKLHLLLDLYRLLIVFAAMLYN